LNLSSMQVELRNIIGEVTADFWATSELTTKLNEGVRRFSQEERWPWLLTEVTNGSLAASATSFAMVEGVNFTRHINVLLTPVGYTRSFRPKRVSVAEGFDLRASFDGTTSAWPEYYYLVSEADANADGLYINTMRFIPTPSRAFTVAYQYFRVPAVLANTTDRVDIPIQFEQAPVHWAAAELWLKELNGATKAGEQMQLYNAILAQAKKDSFSEADDTPLVAGSEAPQPRIPGSDDYTRLRIPETLGP